MKIIIDVEPWGGEHSVETEPSLHGDTEHPDGKSGMTDIRTALKHWSEHPELHKQAGWLVINKLPGELSAITRWQRLLNAVNNPEAPEVDRAMKLK